MTIQIKRGNTADRPNPLLNGEFGWDADTRRLYIGNGVVNENLFVAGAAVSTDFSVYVCTTALGGGAADADGLAKNSGTATATTANKLVDSAASFDSTYVDKTVYNITDDTWAKITAVDSATQLSLSANIMAVGESYDQEVKVRIPQQIESGTYYITPWSDARARRVIISSGW